MPASASSRSSTALSRRWISSIEGFSAAACVSNSCGKASGAVGSAPRYGERHEAAGPRRCAGAGQRHLGLLEFLCDPHLEGSVAAERLHMVRLGRQCHAVVPIGAVEVEPRGVQEPRVVAQHPGVRRRETDRSLQRDLRLVVAVEGS